MKFAVTQCVIGLDPWKNHDGNCLAIRYSLSCSNEKGLNSAMKIRPKFHNVIALTSKPDANAELQAVAGDISLG